MIGPRIMLDALRELAGGHRFIGLCNGCWVRQPLRYGARCLSCRGIVHRVRV